MQRKKNLRATKTKLEEKIRIHSFGVFAGSHESVKKSRFYLKEQLNATSKKQLINCDVATHYVLYTKQNKKRAFGFETKKNCAHHTSALPTDQT